MSLSGVTSRVSHFILKFCGFLSVWFLFVLPPCGVAHEFSPNLCRGERRGFGGRAAPIKPVRPTMGILARGPIAR